VRVNEFAYGAGQKADLWCDCDPPMLGEIKITGADYATKVRYWIEADVERLLTQKGYGMDCYFILVIPPSSSRGVLADYLSSCRFSEQMLERDIASFKLRIWRL